MSNYDIGIAHQKKIRDKRATHASQEDLFGEWWKDIDIDLKKAEVREITRSQCEPIILEYEWLRCMPAVTWHCFGLYFEGKYCGGVVCYGPEYSENLGKLTREKGGKRADWSKYGYEGKMILLSRGACVHWSHPHSASFLIRKSMKMLPTKYEVITCTTDHAAGEIGTIYQACGFHYVGSMREANPNVKSKHMDRDGWLIDDKIWSARSIRQACGTTKIEDIRKIFPNVQKVKQHSKHRYFAFLGSKKMKRKHQRSIQHLIKPYPKRLTNQ